MIVKNKTTHEHKIVAELEEAEVQSILANHIATISDFEIDPRRTKLSIRFDSHDAGVRGHIMVVIITMVNDLSGGGSA